mgnify:CR=1 FL=1
MDIDLDLFGKAYGGMESAQAAVLLEIEKNIYPLKREFGAIVDSKGDLQQQYGGRTSAKMVVNLDRAGSYILTHNHPYPMSFSAADLQVFLGLGLKEMRVIAKDGDGVSLWRIIRKVPRTVIRPDDPPWGKKSLYEYITSTKKPKGLAVQLWIDAVIESERSLDTPVCDEDGKTLSLKGRRNDNHNKFAHLRRNHGVRVWAGKHKKYFDYLELDITSLII